MYGAHSAMCRIFGIRHHARTRGREAVGVAIHDGESIRVREQAGSVRSPSIRENAQRVGFSAEEALPILNAAPKLYW